jgi:two-component system, NtrC family, sensor histidine kinase HydH
MSQDGPEASLTREELERILGAVRTVAQASEGSDYLRVLASVLETTASVLSVDHAVVYLLDEAGEKLVFAGNRPPSPWVAEVFPEIALEGTLSGRAVRTLRTVAYSREGLGSNVHMDRLGIEHLAIVPLHVRRRASGCLHLGRKDRGFAASELLVAETLGELLVVYLENARLYSDARARLTETRMLLDVARSVTASLDLKHRLVASADALARIVGSAHAIVILMAAEEDKLVVTETDSRFTGDIRGVVIPMEGSYAAVRAIRDRAPVIVGDVSTSPGVFRELVDRHAVKSLLALPLFVGGQAIGAAVAIETRDAHLWSAEQVQRGELVAHQIAIAVAHARLYDEVKRGYAELARTQAELVKRARLAALGQLAATLAHEVRNPLGVLFNSICTLGKVLPPSEDSSTLLAIMDEEVRRLERLVRELLDFVRPLAPTLESESLYTVAEGALDAAAQELGAQASTLTNEVSRTLPPVRVDGRMMRRALLNLLVNGAHAAGAEGTVRVTASAESRAERPFVRVDVVDTGPGIPADVAPRVFEPFFTTKATGTGLGLAVVKEIVEAHFGEIEVHSPSDGTGRGTTISLLLPQS